METGDIEKLADAWWNSAESQKDPAMKNLARSRGGVWYRGIAGKLVGLGKAKAELRLKEIGDTTAAANVTRDILPRDPIELLDFIDSEVHAVTQKWDRKGKEIIGPEAHASLLQVPVTVNGSYELTVEFTRQAGGDIVGVMLPVGDRYCNVVLSAAGGVTGLVGEESKNKVDITPCRLTNGKRYVLRTRIVLLEKAATADVSLDEMRFDRWTGAGSLNDNGARKMPQRRHIGLYTNDSQTAFHSVKLTMTSGKATPDANAASSK